MPYPAVSSDNLTFQQYAPCMDGESRTDVYIVTIRMQAQSVCTHDDHTHKAKAHNT